MRSKLLLHFSVPATTLLALVFLTNCATAKLPACCAAPAAPVLAAPPAPKEPECPLVLEIYFDYDRSDLKPEALTLLEVYWACLSKQLEGKSNWVLDIGGYADEWGNRDYNIALGERRSRSVVAYFSAKGVAASQLQIVTYGESVPAVPDHAPSAWAKNRRAVVTVRFK